MPIDCSDTNGAAALKKATILVVDDHKLMVEATKYILIDNGYKVISAFNGLEALQRVEVDLPDLILIDINMPGMDGYATVKHLRQRYKTQDIPIIMFTAYYSVQILCGSHAMGVDDVVDKSLSPEELLGSIRRVLCSKSPMLHSESPSEVHLPGRKPTEQRLTELLFESNWVVLLTRLHEKTSAKHASELLAQGTRADFVGSWDKREFVLIVNPEMAVLEQDWLERSFPKCTIGVVSSPSVGYFEEGEDIIVAAQENIRRKE